MAVAAVGAVVGALYGGAVGIGTYAAGSLMAIGLGAAMGGALGAAGEMVTSQEVTQPAAINTTAVDKTTPLAAEQLDEASIDEGDRKKKSAKERFKVALDKTRTSSTGVSAPVSAASISSVGSSGSGVKA